MKKRKFHRYKIQMVYQLTEEDIDRRIETITVKKENLIIYKYIYQKQFVPVMNPHFFLVVMHLGKMLASGLIIRCTFFMKVILCS